MQPKNYTRYNRTRNFWAIWSRGEQKIAKICLPLGITNKSDFVFTRPRPKGDINRARSEGQARQRENLIATASFRRISVSHMCGKLWTASHRPIAECLLVAHLEI